MTPNLLQTPAPPVPQGAPSAPQGYQPLTPQQYQAARAAGFSPQKILQNEQVRKSQTNVPQPLAPKVGLGQKILNAGTAVANATGFGKTADTIGAHLARTINPDLAPNIPKPTLKEDLGAAANIGSLLTPVGAIEKVGAQTIARAGLPKLAQLGGRVAAGAVAGGAFDVGQHLEANPDGGIGTAIGAGLPVAGAALGPLARTAADRFAGILTPRSAEASNQIISDLYQKGVRPTVVGKSTGNQLDSSLTKQVQAVHAIVENKPNLKILDTNGEPTGKVPQNLHQFTQAIDQTKDSIFKKYNALQKSAGEKGAVLDLKPVASELKTVSNDKVLKDLHPEVVKYANSRASAFNKRGTYTTDQAQSAIKTLNGSLEAFYKNPSYDNASKASVDSLIVNKMRSGLDDAITGVKAKGPKYQDLKNKYGALASIQKDVTHRQIVDARKNPVGLFSGIANIASGAELIRGLATMNPADIAFSLGSKGVSKLIEHQNNPNTSIKALFAEAERARTAATTKTLANRLSTGSRQPPRVPAKLNGSSVPSSTQNGISQAPFRSPGDMILDKIPSIFPKDSGGVPSTPKSLNVSREVADAVNAFDRQPNLSKDDQKVETASIKKYVTQKPQLLSDYKKQFGDKVANTDLARRLFKDVGYNGRNSAAVQEAASALNKDVWRKALQNKEPDAVLYAGGSGSGKSTAVEGLLPHIEKNAAAILDGNLSKMSSALDRIGEATKAGKTPKIVYVYREPVDAWINGVVKRMISNKEEAGRVVPLSTFLENGPGSLKVVQNLAKDGHEVIGVDNSLGAGKAKIMTDKKLHSLSYPTDIRDTLVKKTRELLMKRVITPQQYDALIK